MTSKKSKKIVILELMILIHSDDKFHKFEHKIIEQIASIFKIDSKELNLYSQWGKIASASYTQGKIFLQD
ncbi:MAG: hypothetical protein Q9M43_07990 [Sulfurimonas sp.]|nr:hypothetical protein [Sulfurimonas sp.]